MGMWIELGIFLVMLAWGIWQLQDVKKAKAKRLADEALKKKAGDMPPAAGS